MKTINMNKHVEWAPKMLVNLDGKVQFTIEELRDFMFDHMNWDYDMLEELKYTDYVYACDEFEKFILENN